MSRPYYPRPGEIVPIVGGFSEAMMSMGLAGREVYASLTGGDRPMVQMYDASRRPFSFPVLLGEGGFYRDGGRFYCYRRGER